LSSSLAGGNDIDLFISLVSNCKGTMKELAFGAAVVAMDGKLARRRTLHLTSEWTAGTIH